MLVTCFAIWDSKIHKIHFHALYDVSHAELCCKIYKKNIAKKKNKQQKSLNQKAFLSGDIVKSRFCVPFEIFFYSIWERK